MEALERIDAELAEIKQEIRSINEEFQGKAFTDEAKSRWNEKHERRTELEKLRSEIEVRNETLEKMDGDTRRSESGADFSVRRDRPRGLDVFYLSSVETAFGDPSVAAGDLRDRASRAVEMSHFPDQRISDDEGRSAVTTLLEGDTDRGDVALHI